MSVTLPRGAPSSDQPAQATGDAGRWIESRPTRRWMPRIDLRELWAHRELAAFLAWRELKLRYRQTFFGVAWAVLQPLTGVAIFSLGLGKLAGVPSDGISYPVFVLAGLAAWTYVSTAVERAAQSLIEDGELITKIYFPRLLAPLAATLPGLLDFAISLLLLAVFMAGYGVAPDLPLVLLPLLIVGAVAVAVAVGLWLAALNVRYRDVRYALSFLVQAWFFASPIVYSSSVWHGAWRYVFACNPMVGLIDTLRWSLIGAPAPPPQDLISAGAGIAILLSGALYFQAAERRFADLI